MSGRRLSWLFWECGTPRSQDNAFTLCYDGRPHNYIQNQIKASGKSPAKKTSPRAPRAFGALGGVIEGLGKVRK